MPASFSDFKESTVWGYYFLISASNENDLLRQGNKIQEFYSGGVVSVYLFQMAFLSPVLCLIHVSCVPSDRYFWSILLFSLTQRAVRKLLD